MTERCDRTLVRHTSLLFAISVLTLSCMDPRPRSLSSFDECTRGPIASVRHGEQSVEFECTIHDQMVLVGLPARRVSVAEMVEAGVSKRIAELLASPAQDSNEWCVVRVFADPPDPRTDVPTGPLAQSVAYRPISRLTESYTAESHACAWFLSDRTPAWRC